MVDPPLADELFLIGHDPRSGKPLAPDRALGAALAGAVLIELVQAGRIKVDEHGVVTVEDQRPHGERVTDAALAEILKPHWTRPVRSWIQHLRRHSRIMVASRLVRAGLIQRVPTRSLLGRTIRYPATGHPDAYAPLARLRQGLEHPDAADAGTAVLAAFALGIGLDEVVAGDRPIRTVRAALAQMQQSIPAELEPLVSAAIAPRDSGSPSPPRHSAE